MKFPLSEFLRLRFYPAKVVDPEAQVIFASDLEKFLEGKVVLTREQFFQVVADTMKELGCRVEVIGPVGPSFVQGWDVELFRGWSELAKNLGFKEPEPPKPCEHKRIDSPVWSNHGHCLDCNKTMVKVWKVGE